MNKSILSDKFGNDIRISSVSSYDGQVKFENFSAKYVVSGHETYCINNKKYVVASGEYIVGNKNTEGATLIESKKPVNGICLDVSKSVIDEIIDFRFDHYQGFKKFIFEQEWMVNKYQDYNTNLGYALKQLSHKFDAINDGDLTFNHEIFYSIAECIVKDHENLFKQFQSLKAVKEETNGRLLNFIYDAKNFIDNCFLENIDIEQIAIESKLSQYHFIRLFKTIFNITPYQYILQKRLDFARRQLLEGKSIIDVTYRTNFSNPANFSKAFKNQFGQSPKNMLNQISNF